MQKYFIKYYLKTHMRSNQGFTLIELVIYCAIFVTFAVSVIESIIFINSKMAYKDKMMEIRNYEIYKIYFKNIYKRLGLKNQKIESKFSDILMGVSSTTPTISEDTSLGIILNEHKNIIGTSSLNISSKPETYDLLFFNSIDTGV